MPKLVGRVARYPAQALCAWYLLSIIIGTVLLKQPFCRAVDAEPLTWIDAAFTSTSASCVTGLIVRSTANDFSFFGQLVILVQIQLGGIGIMTVATYLTISLLGQQSLRQRVMISETLGAAAGEDLRRLLPRIIRLVVLMEMLGFLILLPRFAVLMPWPEAIWHSLFHSVSAFCNAGFALHDESLTPYQADVVINAVVMMLIVVGGIGYPVLCDLQATRSRSPAQWWGRLSLHSKLVLIGTAGLLLLGFLALLLLEWNNALREMEADQRILVSLFQSVTTRTAGFNTLEMRDLTPATLFVIILLMFVGASSGSAGGGFKVSTFMVLLLHAHARLTGREQISIFRRTIASDVVGRAIATVMLFALIGTIGLCGILVVEEADLPHAQAGGMFFDALFEVVSALCTVGLSTGFSDLLSTGGKVVIIILMFVGRIGPVSLVALLALRARQARLKYPDETVLIG